MKKILAGVLCFSTAMVVGQDKRNTFSTYIDTMAVVTAKLDKAVNGERVILWEPFSGEVDSTIVKDHQFKFNMPIAKGGSVYIVQIGNVPQKDATLLYLEAGKTDIKGKGRNFDDAKFSGPAYVKEWQEVMVLTDPEKGDGKKFADLEKQYHAAKAIGDDEVADSLSKAALIVQTRIKDRLTKWMTAHPNSGVSAYILTCQLGKNRDYADSVYATWGNEAKNSRIAKRYFAPGTVDPVLASISLGNGELPADMPGKVKTGAAAPDFKIPDLAGNMVSLSDFKGKYVFIDFWASWCSPCIAQVPHMKEINEKFKDKNFVMIGVSLDTKREGWEKSIKKHELNWLNVSNLKGWGEPVAVQFGVRAIPSNVLIGPDGHVIANDLGGTAIEKKLEELLK